MAETSVDAQKLQLFLQQLGRCFRHPATLFLVGGTSLLLAAGKLSTFDVDIQFQAEDEHHTDFVRCLRSVSRAMGIPVELASPDQFIPLPSGYRARCQFVDRYGMIDVYHLRSPFTKSRPITSFSLRVPIPKYSVTSLICLRSSFSSAGFSPSAPSSR